MFLRKILSNRTLLQGFTLVELMVSVAVMSIVLGISLSGGPQAIMRLTLADNTYQAELLIREAQLQGSAVSSVDGLYGGSGIFFDRATSTVVLKFKDRIDPLIPSVISVGNGLYDTSPINEIEKTIKTVNGHRIGTLCVATSTSPLYGGSFGTWVEVL